MGARSARDGWAIEEGFDLDNFLAEPLLARVATLGQIGPTVRSI